MTANKEIVLYDIPNQHGKAWSLNPWKARLALNYKNIPYRTQWIEYPDLAPTFRSLGIPPNEHSALIVMDYTVPTVTLPNGTHVADSIKIAEELEKLQPEPSLRLDNGYAYKALYAIQAVHAGLAPIIFPRVPRQLNEPSAAYFRETRAKRFGMPLDEFEKGGKGGEAGWKAAEKALNDIRSLLNENPGPFIEGEHVSFADFAVAGWLKFYESLNQNGDIFGRVLALDPAFGRLYDACKKWLERDDH